MNLSTESRLAISLLMGLQLLTSGAAIGLLGRVSPAVERILADNVATQEAVEDMMAVLAGPLPADEAARSRFTDARRRAWANVTEETEGPELEALDAVASGALAGSRTARAEALDHLRQINHINRESMREADVQARTLGRAGAWAAALAGLVGFLLSALVYRRLRWRLVGPVLELDVALAKVRRGEVRRRCAPLEGPIETRRIGENLNWLLDQAFSRDGAPSLSSPDPALRAAALALLDARPGPAFLATAEGQVVAVNERCLEQLGNQGPGPVGIARAVRAGHPLPERWQVTTLRSGALLCERGPAPAEAAP